MSMNISTIDTHMAGSPTRVIVDGLPELPGNSISEKMEYFNTHHDDIRKLLILEPRGHKHMWGVVLTKPLSSEADIGAFFINSEGYFPLCIHSTISLVKVCIEYNLIETPESGTAVKIELPLGIATAYPEIVDGKVTSVAVESSDAFVQNPNIKLLLETGDFIKASIVYSGVYFVLVDVNQVGFYRQRSALLKTAEGRQLLVNCAMNLLNQVNKKFKLDDPRDSEQQIPVSLCMFCDEINAEQANDLTISATGAVDRSPCGSAAGAKLALLYSQGRIGQEQSYELFSPIHTNLSGVIIGEDSLRGVSTVIPKITGTSFITGEHRFLLDENDSIQNGFVL